jgi:hypothetical protein
VAPSKLLSTVCAELNLNKLNSATYGCTWKRVNYDPEPGRLLLRRSGLYLQYDEGSARFGDKARQAGLGSLDTRL